MPKTLDGRSQIGNKNVTLTAANVNFSLIAAVSWIATETCGYYSRI